MFKEGAVSGRQSWGVMLSVGLFFGFCSTAFGANAAQLLGKDGQCLTVQGDGTAEVTKLGLTNCGGVDVDREYWSTPVTAGYQQIQGPAGKCLNVSPSTFEAILFRCQNQGEANELWTRSSTDPFTLHVSYLGDGYCLDVNDPTHAVMAVCDGSTGQRWTGGTAPPPAPTVNPQWIYLTDSAGNTISTPRAGDLVNVHAAISATPPPGETVSANFEIGTETPAGRTVLASGSRDFRGGQSVFDISSVQVKAGLQRVYVVAELNPRGLDPPDLASAVSFAFDTADTGCEPQALSLGGRGLVPSSTGCTVAHAGRPWGYADPSAAEFSLVIDRRTVVAVQDVSGTAVTQFHLLTGRGRGGPLVRTLLREGPASIGPGREWDLEPGSYTIEAQSDGAGVFEVGVAEAIRFLGVSLYGTGDGTIMSTPPGLTCSEHGVTCTAHFPALSTVTLAATPAPGSVFLGWIGEDMCPRVTLSTEIGLLECAAHFEKLVPPQLSVRVAGTGGGRIRSNPSGIDCGTACDAAFATGTQVTLTAVADPGSHFDRWTGNSDCTDGRVTMSQAKTCVANFSSTWKLLTITKAGSGDGTVRSKPAGITCGASCSHRFPPGTRVSLTAVPAAGSRFKDWKASRDPDCFDGNVTMSTARTCVASFTGSGG